MELSALLAFVGAATVLMWLPGPDWAFIVAVGTRERLVVPAVTGLVVGYLLMSLTVAIGVAPLVAAAPAALVVITVAGAAYLINLGIGVVRSSGHHASADPDSAAVGGRLLRRGIGVSALNPKSLVLFVAFLPQFVRPAAPWPLVVQLAVLGCVWATIGAVFYTALGYTAQMTLGARPNLAQTVARLAGVAMILAGIALIGEQFGHVLTGST